ncbi:MAG: tryptophan synthase subunit alpha [Clostridiales bacterium]|jgi:tryptophan synthase alpha chain|nr:tryptophan synthase subunit alpha [Clostridiales bacterium]
MSRIKKAFLNGKAFIGFLTGGDPSIEKSLEFIGEMVHAGADIVEIGIPFSDPIAEGPVIQRANLRALSAGATLPRLFGLVESVRKTSEVPLVFLTYLNPVFVYGYDAFFKEASRVGLDGIIIPDLPYEEGGEVRPFAEKYGIDLISLIAPTSDERIGEIAKNAAGFVYAVSSMGVTGMRGEIATDIGAMTKKVKAAAKIPTAIGFGINTVEQARSLSALADGVIVGSAIVKIIEEYGKDAGREVYRYVLEMKKAVTE